MRVVTSLSTRRMIGEIEETSASSEARSAPRSYPTEADSNIALPKQSALLDFIRMSR